jgi:hypothetical protein
MKLHRHTIGNAGFNTLRGPGVAMWDLGLFRQIDFGGGTNLQVRVEAFNVTNRPHFQNPGNGNTNRSNLRLNPLPGARASGSSASGSGLDSDDRR